MLDVAIDFKVYCPDPAVIHRYMELTGLFLNLEEQMEKTVAEYEQSTNNLSDSHWMLEVS